MKTFQRVPPQSTRVQRTVCIWCRLWRGTNRGKRVRASGLLPRQSLLPKTLHTWVGTFTAPIPHSVPTLQPGAPSLRHSQHPAARGRATVLWYLQPSTSPQTAVQSETLLHDQHSSIPKWQYTQLLSTRNPFLQIPSATSHLLPRSVRPAAPKDPFGYSEQTNYSWFISSELWFRVKTAWFLFSRVQKRSLTLSLDYSSLERPRKKNRVS